jgi:hypothetical protein
MIVKEFTIDVYNWKVIFISFSVDQDKPKKIKRVLKAQKFPKDLRQSIFKYTMEGGWGADYISKLSSRRSAIIVHNCTTAESAAEVISHEISHITDMITEGLSLECTEAKAFIMGYMAYEILPLVFKLKK